MSLRSLLIVALTVCAVPTEAAGTRLLRQPDVDARHVVFAYAGDIWVAARDDGDARRLTSFPGVEAFPRLSPDGERVLFSGQYDGNTDVFVVPIAGGSPERLSFHPGADTALDWSPDGDSVLFLSGRDGPPVGVTKAYRVPVDGGYPEVLPVPRIWKGQLDGDGSHLAYAPITPWDVEWRNYRGGQTRPIWLLQMSSLELTKLPWDGSMDTDPVWIGETIYFLSDRDWAANVWSWNTRSRELKQVTFFKEFDCKNLQSGGGALIFENGGWLHVWQPGDAKPTQLEITVRGDLPWARPHWEDVGDALRMPALSPTGKRALFEARGEIFTVPVEKGDWRNLTQSSGVADRAPIWSPDGSKIAWFSDRDGEYAMMIAEQDGLDAPRKISLDEPTFFFTPAWSPDGEKILFTDEELRLSYVVLESGEQVHVDTDGYATPTRTVDPVWSPDSRYIAYAKRLDSQFHAVMVHDLESGENHQLTDGLSDALAPAWDASGKYLWFLSSTNYGPNVGWLDLAWVEREVRREVYLAVLANDEPSPLLPNSDEEEVASDEEPEAKEDEELRVEIDWDGIHRRILSIDAPSRAYTGLLAGSDGVVFYAEAVANQPGTTLHRYSLEDRESKEFVGGVTSATLSHDRKKLLYGTRGGWHVVDAGSPPSGGKGKLDTALRMKVDPREEWRQIFREAWRYQRDFFYVDNIHGADWDWVYEAYSPWVEHVGHRSDLTHLLDVLGGETAVGHSFVGGGDNPDVESVPVGLLGADYAIEKGRYRFERIHDGENWNPGLRAPLAAPGIDVSAGDWLVGVNGEELTAETNLHAALEGTAERQTVLHINDKPSMKGAREVTVVPVASEFALRQRSWVEDNRRKVDELSDGKLAYVWLPNTGFGGYSFFNRYFFAQQHKQGAVIDERFNGGGFAADYIVDLLSRELQGFFNNPVGENKPFTNPNAGIWGPKVLIINESAGSGGDLLPWMFRNMKIGPLIGTRTWGGLVGIWDVPPLVDGGLITAPRGGFYNNEGEWAVENEGVAPDIEVEQTPKEVAAGRDPQLERAVAEALRLLENYDGQPILPQPADPVRSRRPQ